MAITGDFYHAPQNRHGEKLAYFEPVGIHNYVEATKLWIDEKRNYQGKRLGQGSGEKDKNKRWGHYIAIVWPEARKVGMGYFDVPDDGEWATLRRTYVVVRYDVMQKVGEMAGRVSAGNAYGYTPEKWEEELWIQRFRRRNRL